MSEQEVKWLSIEQLYELTVELREAIVPYTKERLSDEHGGAKCDVIIPAAQRLRIQAERMEQRDREIMRARKALAAVAGLHLVKPDSIASTCGG